MHQLLLMRHAKASRDDPSLKDHARPLTAKGRRAAHAMRDAMRELGLDAPDLVLVSSARRTLETLEALEPWDATPLVEPLDTLYMASADQILLVLNGVAETVRSVLVIGHNPGLHELATAIAGQAGSGTARRLAEGFPTAALVEFAVPGPWSHLRAGGGRLLRFLSPKDLPELAS
jgi:phosphohistidine phosphatase